MNINVKETTIVKPAEKTPRHTIWLSSLDLVNKNVHSTGLCFYRYNGASNFFDTAQLKEALSKVLVPFYPFAGRFNHDENGRLEINCNEEGVLFVEAETSSNLDDLGDFMPSPDLKKLITTIDQSGGVSSFPFMVVQDGDYTVKSGYKVGLESRGFIEPSKSGPMQQWWKILWGLKLPPKVKSFCWKLCKGWLPTSLALSWQGMKIDKICFRCKSHTESIFHALWKCSLVKDIWILCGFNHFIDQNWEYDIIGFLWRMHNLLSPKEFQLFITVSWQVWAARNSHFHKNSCPSPKRVVDDAIKWLDDFISVTDLKTKNGTNRSDDTRWKPPDRGKFLINVDAATNIRSGTRGLCVIIRNYVGEVLYVKAIHWPFPISVDATEALAIKWGIITALEAGLIGFSIASDCASIVNALNNGIMYFGECGNILDEILNLFSCSYFEGLLFMFRCANRAAHNIARFAALSNRSQTWLEEILICASSIVFAEK